MGAVRYCGPKKGPYLRKLPMYLNTELHGAFKQGPKPPKVCKILAQAHKKASILHTFGVQGAVAQKGSQISGVRLRLREHRLLLGSQGTLKGGQCK